VGAALKADRGMAEGRGLLIQEGIELGMFGEKENLLATWLEMQNTGVLRAECPPYDLYLYQNSPEKTTKQLNLTFL
jgi:hypothetical protein